MKADWLAVLLCCFVTLIACENALHGGTILALAGKDSVLIATDSRFSSQQTGPYLLGEHYRTVCKIGNNVLIGCYGLDSDSRLLVEILRTKFVLHAKDSFKNDNIRKDNNVEPIYHPGSVSRVVSNSLYSSNLAISPIVVGLNNENKPYICSMDGLGAQTLSDTFAICGTSTASLMAVCEQYYQPNLDSSELVQLAEKCLKLALQRDVLSGCSVRLYILTCNSGIVVKDFHTSDV